MITVTVARSSVSERNRTLGPSTGWEDKEVDISLGVLESLSPKNTESSRDSFRHTQISEIVSLRLVEVMSHVARTVIGFVIPRPASSFKVNTLNV